MIDIYSYIDYRSFIADYYADRKTQDRHFTYQLLAGKAGFKARDFIYRVTKGERSLSDDSIPRLIGALELTGAKAEYFAALVAFAQAADHAVRQRAYERLRSLNPRLKRGDSARVIPHHHYELFSRWYHVVVRSIIGMYRFEGDWEWLAARLDPPITPFQAKKSVALLVRLGLANRDEHGVYSITEKDLATGDDVKRYALHDFYRWGMERAAALIEELPREERNVTGITLGISRKNYGRIVERIAEFRRELAAMAREDRDANIVYQCNFQLFPLSSRAQDGTTEKRDDQ